MARTILTLLCTGLLLIGAGCSKVINIDIRHDQQIDYLQYQTFAFLDQSGKPARLDDPFLKSPLARDTIRQIIEEELIERGFQRDRINDADFLIAIHAGTGDFLRQEMKRWHYSFARHWHFSDDIQYPGGTLILDFFDQGLNTAFWRGSAADMLKDNGGVSKDLRKAISKLLDAYPPEEPAIDSSSV